jgi:poly-gamma-glutamate synthesis protein (capsule biosynthesis protein)
MLDDDAMERVLSGVDFSRIDCLVAIVHWGNEYERRPNAEQLRIERFLRERGVDVIIGSHPHVVQRFDVDTTEGVTLYSLGNFVSNQQRRYCDGGLVATIDITKQCGELSYSAKVEPVWVRKEGYVVIPQSVADTLSLSPNERALYNRFITDTEALLSE